MAEKYFIPHGSYLECFTQLRLPKELERRIAKLRASQTGSKKQKKHIAAMMSKLDDEEIKYLERVRDIPLARQSRTPFKASSEQLELVCENAYASIRKMPSRCDEYLLVEISSQPGIDRVLLTHSVVDGEAKLQCDGHDVELLPLCENFDILARAGQFMAASIELLGLTVYKSDAKSLEPFKELMSWWLERSEPLPPGSLGKWEGTWIQNEFDRRRTAVEKGRRIENPLCLDDLLREMFYDPKLTNTLCDKHASLGIDDLPASGFVEPILLKVARSAFRNGAKWASHCTKGTWYGRVLPHVKNLGERERKRLKSGRKTTPELPRGHGETLLKWVGHSETLGAQSLGLSIENILRRAASVSGDEELEKLKKLNKQEKLNEQQLKKLNEFKELKKLAAKYGGAKLQAAKARFYVVLLGLQEHLPAYPTHVQIQRGIMGLSRAIDAWVEDYFKEKQRAEQNNEPKQKRKTARGEFLTTAKQRIVASLADENGTPKHPWDEELLRALTLHGPDAVIFNSLEEKGDKPSATSWHRVCDASDQAATRMELEELMNLAELSPKERRTIERRYLIDCDEESCCDKDVFEAAIKKLSEQAAIRKNLKKLMDLANLSPAERQAIERRYRVDVVDDSCCDKDVFEAAIKKLRLANSRLKSNKRGDR